jgi:hypothetical protein
LTAVAFADMIQICFRFNSFDYCFKTRDKEGNPVIYTVTLNPALDKTVEIPNRPANNFDSTITFS